MIQKMKKFTFLVMDKEYEGLVTELGKLGVMHIQQLQKGASSEALEEAISLEKRYRQALATLDKVKAEHKPSEILQPIPRVMTPEYVLNKVESFQKVEERLLRRIQNDQNKINALEPWGEFHMSDVRRLENASDLKVWFLRCPSKGFKAEWGDKYFATEISERNKQTYFIAFAKEQPDIEAELLDLHSHTVSDYEEYLRNNRQHLQKIHDGYLRVEKFRRDLLEKGLRDAQNEIQLSRVHLSDKRVAGDVLRLLIGFVSTDETKALTEYLDHSGVYYEMEEPSAGDNVPIIMKNNRFNRMFERLTKMYGYPSYNEWDPTPIVAIFFTLFFAICMGDAGYGIIIALYGFFEMKGKCNNVPIVGDMLKGAGDMILALGVATTLVGVALGTFFGLNMASLMPALSDYYAFVQGNFPGTNYSFQMVCAIIIGVVHICLAMLIKSLLFTKKEGFKSQLGQWGWTLLILGSVIVGTLAMIGALPQQVTLWLMIAIGGVSALCIYILNNVARLQNSFVKGIIINPLTGLYDTYNMASGLMGDVLSYIRLYALCLAGGMLGQAFNTIGDMCPIYVGVIIYAVGHLLNLLLSAISAFVHPLRLNFVEYFKNSGYEGKGEGFNAYKIK